MRDTGRSSAIRRPHGTARRSRCFRGDDDGRVLLVKQADNEQWATIGGAVEPDESPAEAVRETAEEAGVTVQLRRVRAVLGGPEFRVRYPGGDETSQLTTVFDARVTAGTASADGDETLAAKWFAQEDLAAVKLSPTTWALLRGAGVLPVATPAASVVSRKCAVIVVK